MYRKIITAFTRIMQNINAMFGQHAGALNIKAGSAYL